MTAVDTADQPYSGKTLRYSVSGANPQAGSIVLGAAGQAQISYVGANAGSTRSRCTWTSAEAGVADAGRPGGYSDGTFVPAPPDAEQQLQSPEHQGQLERNDHDRVRAFAGGNRPPWK